jgi:hypothetical protein
VKDKERGRDNGAAARVLDASSGGGGGGGSDGDGGSDKVRTVWCQEERSRMRAAALRVLRIEMWGYISDMQGNP